MLVKFIDDFMLLILFEKKNCNLKIAKRKYKTNLTILIYIPNILFIYLLNVSKIFIVIYILLIAIYIFID